MSVKEVVQALGGWGITLKSSTPRELIAEIERNKFGHIAILPGRINPSQYGDGLLREARYVGVYRSTFKQSDDTIQIKGAGMAFWLGDEDGKGDIFETPVVLNDVTFPNAIRALLPVSGAVEEGTLHSIPGAGLYSKTHVWETPRSAITYVTETFTTSEAFTGTERIVEYRVNGDGTLDAGPIENLYNTVPRAILVRKDTGRDMRLLGLQADMSMDYDVEDLTTRVVLLAQGEGATIATASANAAPTGYVDLFGNPIKQTRLVSESGTPTGNAEARAQLQLTRWTLPRQAIQIRTQEFDIKGDFAVGDYIYVFDPEAGFYDLANEVFWRGQPINPLALRVKEMDWGVRPGWTVGFRKNNGEWLDLSEYYKPETGGSTLAVGDYRRTLAGNNYEPLGFRPNLPDPGADSTVPASPAFTGFSVGSYQSETMTAVKAAIRAQWSEPLNTDGSTITDGDHYEIRHRVNTVVGYQVPWDTLTGYVNKVTDTFGARTNTNGMGTAETGGAYTVVDGTAANISVAGGKGIIALNAVDDVHLVRLSTAVGRSHGQVDVTIPVMPTGGSIAAFVCTRFTDVNNFMGFGFFVETNGSLTCTMLQRVGGVDNFIGGLNNPGITHVAGKTYTIKFNNYDNKAYSKVYVAGEPEPADWINSGDITIPESNAGFGLYTKLDFNNTNSFPVPISFDNISVYAEDVAQAYSWDDLGTWDGLISSPVAASPAWQTSFVGWDDLAFTLMELTPGITYELQIRAVDAASPPKSSAWSASAFVTTSGDIFAPSTPAAPIVAVSMIAIQVQHNLGKSSGGEFNLELDLDHIDVHVGLTSDFLVGTDNKVGELIATGGMVAAGIPALGSFKIDNTEGIYVKVVAVDSSGNKSPASNAVTATVELIDNAHISDLSVSKVTAGTITATWIMSGAIKTAESGARVELTSGGIEAFNASGDKTVDINSADGSGSFTGTLRTRVDDSGISFLADNTQAAGYWSINDGLGVPLDHQILQWALSLGVFGQAFETSIRRRADSEQDGGKLLLTEIATVLSHQPDIGEEAFLSLGGWPGAGTGGIYLQGSFGKSYLLDGTGSLWLNRSSVTSAFNTLVETYGPTMSGVMTPGGIATGAIGTATTIIALSATGFSVSWAHPTPANCTVMTWSFRTEAVV